jgi:hypothetical protein
MVLTDANNICRQNNELNINLGVVLLRLKALQPAGTMNW